MVTVINKGFKGEIKLKNKTFCKIIDSTSDHNGRFVFVKGVSHKTAEDETFYIVELTHCKRGEPVFSNGYSCTIVSEKNLEMY